VTPSENQFARNTHHQPIRNTAQLYPKWGTTLELFNLPKSHQQTDWRGAG